MVVDGLYRAYLDDMGPTRDEMSYLANTFVDVMVLEDGNYAGNVEGKCGKGKESCTKYVRPAFLLLIQFRPDYYEQIVGKNFKEEKNTNNFKRVSRFLWLKNIRFTQGADWKSAPSKFKVSYVILIAIVSSLIVCCAWLIVKICIELYS